jgi:hypothetical protein
MLELLHTAAFACVIAVSTPAGEICVKPDGNVEYPAGVALDRISRQFWEEVGRGLPRDFLCGFRPTSLKP